MKKKIKIDISQRDNIRRMMMNKRATKINKRNGNIIHITKNYNKQEGEYNNERHQHYNKKKISHIRKKREMTISMKTTEKITKMIKMIIKIGKKQDIIRKMNRSCK